LKTSFVLGIHSRRVVGSGPRMAMPPRPFMCTQMDAFLSQ
jgi:hypothetical protein